MLLIIIIVCVSIVALWLGANLLTSKYQGGWLFRPTPLKDTHEFVFMEPFREMNITGAKGGTLNALLFPTRRTEPKGLIIYFPGNNGNLERSGEANTIFTKAGYDFFVFDHYGFGKSKGPMDEESFYENARIIYNQLKPGYKGKHIILYGRSIGCAMAAKLATEEECSNLILETPFSSVKDLFHSYYGFLPPIFIHKYNFPLSKYIQEVPVPVHIFHGSKDTLIPFSASSKLQTLLKHTDEYVVIHGGRNNNLYTFSEYHDTMEKILYADVIRL